MNTQPILMVDVKKHGFPWVLVIKGQVVTRGVAANFEEIAVLQKVLKPGGVWIDEGYRTEEVRAAAQTHGWLGIRGKLRCYGPCDIMNELMLA